MRNFLLTLKDTAHKVTVKFVHAFLPTAKKPYNARVVLQTELNLEAIADKALLYNIDVSPARILEGTTAFCILCYCLTGDGYKLKTPLFNSYIRIPGEYEGFETSLPEGEFPALRMEMATEFRKYIREHVKVVFDGIDEATGFIGEALDELTGSENEFMTVANILDVRGSGLKIAADEEHASEVGFFFASEATGEIKVNVIPVNEPKLVKVIVPPLPAGEYTIIIRTQSSTKSASAVLKHMREIKSEFTLTPA